MRTCVSLFSIISVLTIIFVTAVGRAKEQARILNEPALPPEVRTAFQNQDYERAVRGLADKRSTIYTMSLRQMRASRWSALTATPDFTGRNKKASRCSRC